MKCSICNNEIEKNEISSWDKGNNAQPINNGRCCDECNTYKIIPARLMNLKRR